MNVGFPLGDQLGLEVDVPAPGHAVATVEAGEDHHSPHGSVHGAVLFAMADTAMGAATLSVLDEGERCVTIEVQLRFLRPVFDGRVTADTVVLHRGRRVVQLESRLTDADDRLVAVADGSFAVIA